MTELITVQAYLAQVTKQVSEITPEQLIGRLKNHKDNDGKLVIIDVRETAEYSAGAIPCAKHIPRGILEMYIHDHLSALGKLSAEQEIILYCRSGGRSALAALSLQNMGFNNVFSLAGGFVGYSACELDS
ncbi:rhodanese domain-containing protein [Catenovulum agarivorans DS-2]|uniref:Rhodanese domain-containing protein n=1 Tax=Catenovulum agarivorans DS-2 TaxID=1328313 RepID=W7QFQ4_9ALTE|nr:rhodanese-like domain-containing protein [Catenovulum agarivorans]EWH11749.1 rhodanese domain-containing protein [Catenovulum agarivorans DS-2]